MASGWKLQNIAICSGCLDIEIIEILRIAQLLVCPFGACQIILGTDEYIARNNLGTSASSSDDGSRASNFGRVGLAIRYSIPMLRRLTSNMAEVLLMKVLQFKLDNSLTSDGFRKTRKVSSYDYNILTSPSKCKETPINSTPALIQMDSMSLRSFSSMSIYTHDDCGVDDSQIIDMILKQSLQLH